MTRRVSVAPSRMGGLGGRDHSAPQLNEASRADCRFAGELPVVRGVVRPPQRPHALRAGRSKSLFFTPHPRTWGCRPPSYTGLVKSAPKPRSILHVDLDPFVVSVERSLEPALRERPLIIGSGIGEDNGLVVAASTEARAAGVRPGQTLATARRRCPEAALRSGD